MSKIGVLLVNLGTPDSPETPDVRKYLREFLMDERVIDIPTWKRWLLINLIIAPLRSPKSAAEYKKLWTENGSPLLHYGKRLHTLTKEALGDEYAVELAMRYQSPSIVNGLKNLAAQDISELIVLPLFPQYAEASTGSVIAKVNEEIKAFANLPTPKFVEWFHHESYFIDALAAVAQPMVDAKDWEHYIFSYHGIPERQILKQNYEGCCRLQSADCNIGTSSCRNCYRYACVETTVLLTEVLNIPKEKYTICFQSRLGKTPWIQPFTDHVIDDLAEKGIKRILAFSPSFIADCLETTLEVGETYAEQFEEKGGEEWQLVPSLNESDLWVKAVSSLIKSKESKKAEAKA